MKKETPYLILYGCTYTEAKEVINCLALRHCEPDWDQPTAVWFSDYKDLVLFALQFRSDAMLDGDMAVLHPMHKVSVLNFIETYGMEERVECFDLLGVWFRSEDDEVVFNQELGIST